MNRQLRAALEARGWEELYTEAGVEHNGRANRIGEIRSRSPFPDAGRDSNPSFTFNIYNGGFRCYHTNREGGFIHFLGWMWGEDDEESGEFVPVSPREVERRLLLQYQIVNPIAPEWVEQCRQALPQSVAAWGRLESHNKSWSAEKCFELGVGWWEEKECFTIPCYDALGILQNVRCYKPGGTPKAWWAAPDLGGNYLVPHCVRSSPFIILVEGEADAITLQSLGFAAATGTYGSASPVPEGNWFRRKNIYLLFDIDSAGQSAVEQARATMVRDATSIRIVALPEWLGRSERADISDYVSHLRSLGHSDEQLREAISTLLATGVDVPPPDSVLDAEPLEVSFHEAEQPCNHERRVKFRAHLIGVSDEPFQLPTEVEVRCPRDGHSYCRLCPVIAEGMTLETSHRPSNPFTLKMIDVSEMEQIRAMKDRMGIPLSCPDVRFDPVAVRRVQRVIIGPPLDIDDAGDVRRQALLILPEYHVTIEPGKEYWFVGFMRAEPKKQAAVFLVDSFYPASTNVDQFVMTEDIYAELKAFQPRTGQSVWEKLSDVGQDYIDAVTGIRGRVDLHLAYRSVYHSVLRFNCGNEEIRRGWLECLVLGDTACGKSAAFKSMAEWLGVGQLVDCKNQSVPGILGAATQMASGQWFIVPGVYPRNDRKIVCFDEFNTRLDKSSLIEHLAVARSEGITDIQKAAVGRFKSRVRSIWLANPGQGRLLSEIGACGVELIPRLIPQPEDIRRFDFALLVAQEEVPSEIVQTGEGLITPQYSQEAARNLLLWTWSRTPEQIEFTTEAVELVMQLAKVMADRYSERIPIVERNEQRKRVAKLSLSVAAQCFSTDELGEKIIVTPYHVEAAGQLFVAWYDKAAMDFIGYTERLKAETDIVDAEGLEGYFNNALKPNGERAAAQLLRMREFRDRMLGSIINAPVMSAHQVLPTLIHHRLVQPVDGGKRDTYEVSPAGVGWLKKYLRI